MAATPIVQSQQVTGLFITAHTPQAFTQAMNGLSLLQNSGLTQAGSALPIGGGSLGDMTTTAAGNGRKAVGGRKGVGGRPRRAANAEGTGAVS